MIQGANLKGSKMSNKGGYVERKFGGQFNPQREMNEREKQVLAKWEANDKALDE